MSRQAAAKRSRSRSAMLQTEDALFLYAQTPFLCQQVGAVVLLETASTNGADFSVEDLRAAISRRLRGVPELRRKLEPPRNSWRRPYWVPDEVTDAEERIRAVAVSQEGARKTFSDIVSSFFSDPCDPYRRPWEMLLVRGRRGSAMAVLVKVHHTLGDSRVIIRALTKLFDDVARSGWRPAGVAARSGTEPDSQGSQNGIVQRAVVRLAAAGRALRGIYHLAAAGTAPASSLCGPFTAGRRRYIPIALPARDFAGTARALNAGITDLLVAAVAEALSRLLRARGEETAGRMLRIAVPRARPAAAAIRRRSGNRSAAISVDVPVGPLPPAERLAAVRAQIGQHVRRGEADGAALALRAMALFPPPVQKRAAAGVYQRRWFNVLVSIFVGDRRSHRLLGARVREVYPVLPLADGVGLAIGAMTWQRSLSIGILADAALIPDADKLAAGLADAFRDYQTAASEDAGTGSAARFCVS